MLPNLNSNAPATSSRVSALASAILLSTVTPSTFVLRFSVMGESKASVSTLLYASTISDIFAFFASSSSTVALYVEISPSASVLASARISVCVLV